MPYIKEDERQQLDICIDQMIACIFDNKTSLNNPHNFQNYLGRINYCFSRVLAGLMQEPSYNKIAMITGVLENIKQEFYRRIATPYENQKIIENGDISEYKKHKII
jgi:hypothetical protein